MTYLVRVRELVLRELRELRELVLIVFIASNEELIRRGGRQRPPKDIPWDRLQRLPRIQFIATLRRSDPFLGGAAAVRHRSSRREPEPSHRQQAMSFCS